MTHKIITQDLAKLATQNEQAVKSSRPSLITDEHLEYLDDLRESGITNMFGASVYIEDEFDVSRADARLILSYWMKTFKERHDNE